jgi:phage baseplate assembly protein W
MTIQGVTLSHPVRPNQKGTLASIGSEDEIIRESIMAIVETRQGERVMLPDYGIPDFVFDVMDAGFTARMAYFIETQVVNYEPLVEKARGTIGLMYEEDFIPGFTENQQIAAISVQVWRRGQRTPRTLVFPTWQLKDAALREVA